MHKLLLFVTVFFLSFSSSFASEERCKSILTDNHDRNSSVFSMNIDSLQLRDYGSDHLAEAIAIVRALIDEMSCSAADVNFGKGPMGKSHNRCSQTIRHKPYTRVCVIETNLGLFTVKKDFQTTVNIIFENWD